MLCSRIERVTGTVGASANASGTSIVDAAITTAATADFILLCKLFTDDDGMHIRILLTWDLLKLTIFLYASAV